MKIIISLLLFLLAIPLSASAKDIIVEGYVADAFTQIHIPYVNVVLLRPDSSMVDNALSTNEKNNAQVQSFFSLKVTKEGKYMVRCSHIGYETTYKNIDVQFHQRSSRINIGGILMKAKARKLKEVTVTATRIKMVVKNDTVVYDADAFNLAEGSMLDALVRQLPGAELKDDGRIMVNGKFVQSLLLNGKDFFSGDPKVALENLPSYMINKVKVYDKESDRDRLMGLRTGEKRFVMDVQLKKQYSIGWIANAEGGIGSDNRYMGKLFGLRFTPHSRLSFFGNLNNLNDSRTPGSNGDWTPAAMPDGLLMSKVGGIDYRLEGTNESYIIETSNRVEHKSTDNQTEAAMVTFLPGGNAYSRSFNASSQKSAKYTTNNSGMCRPYGQFLAYNLYLDYSTYKNNSLSRLGNFSDDPSLHTGGNVLDSLFAPAVDARLRKITVNRRWQEALGEGNELNTHATVQSTIRTSKLTRDRLMLEAYAAYSTATNKAFSRYRLDYPADEQQPTDFRNQYNDAPGRNFNYKLNAAYAFNLNDNLSITPFYNYRQTYRSAHNSLYRLDRLPGWDEGGHYPLGALPSTTDELQLSIDEQNSFYSNRHDYRHSTGLEAYAYIKYESGNTFTVNASLPANIEKNQLDYHRNATYYPLSRKTVFVEPNLSLRLLTDKGTRTYWLQYALSSQAPEMTYLLNIRDDSNPLHISVGNPYLENTHTHSFELSYGTYKAKQEQNFKVGMNYWLTQNAIAMGFLYDRKTGVRTTTPANVSGNWGGSAYINFGRALGKSHRWSFSTATHANYNNSVDMVGVEGMEASQRSSVRNLYLTENLRLDYRLGSFQVGAKARGNLTHATSQRADFTTINAADFNYGLTGQVELPWQMQLSTDLTIYSRRGYSIASMNTDELVWNARLAKRCMKGNLTFILDGFDILGNLSNVRQYVNAQGRSEYHYNVIPSYGMLRAVYRLNLQPKNKK